MGLGLGLARLTCGSEAGTGTSAIMPCCASCLCSRRMIASSACRVSAALRRSSRSLVVRVRAEG